MKIRNKIGAKWNPWGTPKVACIGIDQNSLYATICWRSSIKEIIQNKKDPSIPIYFNFIN